MLWKKNAIFQRLDLRYISKTYVAITAVEFEADFSGR
jgi:hypothetical protein